jgi:signal transduction histidine kinase
MDFLSRFKRQVRNHVLLILLIEHILLMAAAFLGITYRSGVSELYVLVAFATCAVTVAILIANSLSSYITKPISSLWQAIQHVSPHGDQQPAPNLEQLAPGKELVSNLANHVYQLANVVNDVEQTNAKVEQDLHRSFVASSLPLPLLVLDGEENIVYLNEAAAKYLARPAAELEGQNVYTALDMSFASEDTLADWLKTAKGKTAVADKKWERVRIGLPGQRDSLLFDMAGYYNQNNSMGYETMLVLFDHTEVYSQDDQAMSFVSLSVHELRTPLTLLRGYIEVFDEELGPTLDDEMKGFMHKMDASAQQLTAFIDNILNVAKIEDNQLMLQLHEENWSDVVQNVVSDLSLRARVRGITIKTDIATDLPPVGVDRYSIYEVLANLLDNAIKYSKSASEIYVTSNLTKDGSVETSVKDFGLGMDANVLPHVFDKFYRNHRNRSQIGGTGLGLYLSKTIVEAHGGTISVVSKADQGSTFSFTVLPYSRALEAGKSGKNSEISRSAHGWIKNHSLFRD